MSIRNQFTKLEDEMAKSQIEFELLQGRLWMDNRLSIDRKQLLEFEQKVMQNISAQYRYLNAIKDAALFKKNLDH